MTLPYVDNECYYKSLKLQRYKHSSIMETCTIKYIKIYRKIVNEVPGYSVVIGKLSVEVLCPDHIDLVQGVRAKVNNASGSIIGNNYIGCSLKVGQYFSRLLHGSFGFGFTMRKLLEPQLIQLITIVRCSKTSSSPFGHLAPVRDLALAIG